MFVCSGSLRGIELRRVTYEGTNVTVGDPVQLIPDCRCFTFGPKYNVVAFYTRSGIQSAEFPDKVVHICAFNPEAGTIREIQAVNVPNVLRVEFSPNGTFFAIVLRKNNVTESEKIPLVQVFRTGGPMVRSFNYPSRGNVTMFWSEDERIFGATFGSGVKFWQVADDGTETEHTAELPHLHACAFSCSRGVVRFAAVFGTDPKRLMIYQFPNFEKPIAQRPVMIGEEWSVVMSPNGSSAIAIGTKNSDATYFGESFAYYLNAQGQQKMQKKKDGPVHCMKYSLTGDKFISIVGHVPPVVAVHHENVGTMASLGEMNVNSARWSCSSNLVAVGGFGGMAGELKVIDSNTHKVIAHGEAQCTSEWSWSPCGRLILTAVLYPKMMVSNEFRIHNHVCQVVASVKIEELTQCEWVGLSNPLPVPKIVAPTTAPPVQAAYVPPHLRGKKPGPPGSGAPKKGDGPPGF